MNRQRSGTSMSEGPSRSSASRTAAVTSSGLRAWRPGTPIGGGEPEEVGVVQLGVDVTALVGAVLDVLDRAVGGVVVDDRDHPEAIPRRGGQLLRGHDEAAVAADRDDRPVAQGRGRPDGRRERPAQRDVVRRVEERARDVRRPVRLHPIADLAGVGEDGHVVGQDRSQGLDQPFGLRMPGGARPRPRACPSRSLRRPRWRQGFEAVRGTRRRRRRRSPTTTG